MLARLSHSDRCMVKLHICSYVYIICYTNTSYITSCMLNNKYDCGLHFISTTTIARKTVRKSATKKILAKVVYMRSYLLMLICICIDFVSVFLYSRCCLYDTNTHSTTNHLFLHYTLLCGRIAYSSHTTQHIIIACNASLGAAVAIYVIF